MTYTPTEWKNGDTITAEKLNNMEQGIADAGGCPLLVTMELMEDETNYVLDKTWQEIHDALLSNGVTVLEREMGDDYEYDIVYTLKRIDYDPEDGYAVGIGEMAFIADSADGYPQTDN